MGIDEKVDRKILLPLAPCSSTAGRWHARKLNISRLGPSDPAACPLMACCWNRKKKWN